MFIFLDYTLQSCAIDSRFLHKTVLKSCLLRSTKSRIHYKGKGKLFKSIGQTLSVFMNMNMIELHTYDSITANLTRSK